jgi:CTP synthase
VYIDAEELEQEGYHAASSSSVDGILVPGGFGERGTEGKIRAIRFAREQEVPFFGICLGMQCAVIEFARNVCGLAGANSTEFDEDAPHKVIYKLRDLIGVDALGRHDAAGQVPLQAQAEGSIARVRLRQAEIEERHRHRYEVNPEYVPR